MSIQHVVVVLFENRSYDNVLGALYQPGNLSPYDKAPLEREGLNGLKDEHSNPCPVGSRNNPCPPGVSSIPARNQTTPTRIEGSDLWYAPTAIPVIDPAEPFKDMAQQLLGLPHRPTSNPYVGYPPEDRSLLCKGFTLNYAQQTWSPVNTEAPVPADNVKDVMNYLTPAQMPVSAFLAHHYGVCDEWFASVPTQTFTNRAFAMCAAPGQSVNLLGRSFSLIDDIQYVLDPLRDIPTVMKRMEEVHGKEIDGVPTWKVYFHDYSVAIETVPHVANAANSADNKNVGTFDHVDWKHQTPHQLKGGKSATTFLHDLKAGRLPKFSFIEPRFFDNYAHADLPAANNHPGIAKYPTHLTGSKAPTDAATGEAFLMQLYNLLRSSPCWENTLLIITYDEHGGVFEHEPPPAAPPPGEGVPPVLSLTDAAANGFNFNVLGGRVPAIIVSPHIHQGQVVRKTADNGKTQGFDHTSIIRTVWDLFDLDNGTGQRGLTQRDRDAPSLKPFIHDDVVNTTGALSDRIVAGPGMLNFVHHHGWPGEPAAQFVLASSGPGLTLSATGRQDAGLSWLSVRVEHDAAAMAATIRVSVCTTGLSPAVYLGHVEITDSANNRPLSIPVNLIVKPIL